MRKRKKEGESKKEIKKEHSPKFWSTAARFIANAATHSSSWNDSLALLLESVRDRWPCVLLTASYKAICAATRPGLSASSAETEPSGRWHPGRSSEDGVGTADTVVGNPDRPPRPKVTFLKLSWLVMTNSSQLNSDCRRALVQSPGSPGRLVHTHVAPPSTQPPPPS